MLEPTAATAANMTVLALNHLLPPPPTSAANGQRTAPTATDADNNKPIRLTTGGATGPGGHNNNNNNEPSDLQRSSPASAAARPSGHIKFSVAALLADTRPVRSPTPNSVYNSDDMDTPPEDDDDRDSVDVETTDGPRRCSSGSVTPGRSPPVHGHRSPLPPPPPSHHGGHHQPQHQHPFHQPGSMAARAAFIMSAAGAAASAGGHHPHHPVAPVRPTPTQFTAFAAAAAAAYSAAGMQHPAAPGAWHPHYAGAFPAFGSAAGLNSGSPGKSTHSLLLARFRVKRPRRFIAKMPLLSTYTRAFWRSIYF